MERKHVNKSWLLSKILDRELIGTQEMLAIRRRYMLLDEHMCGKKIHYVTTGSIGEGFKLPHSDIDMMFILPDVAVLYSETYPDFAEYILNKTVFFLRETDCQPGYVSLELAFEGENMEEEMKTACISFQNSIFISSDIFRQKQVEVITDITGISSQANGPCVSFMFGGFNRDTCYSFVCLNWPREALAWISRTRLYGWPPDALINKIVQAGCHVVPLGDRRSKDTSLLWRISFATAEKQLVHSLSHLQMKVYVLMKYFLTQINDLLRNQVKEDKILSSYIAKTIIFYAVENSPPSLWQDNHTFTCFQFCLSILIDWVKSAYCPQYFIPQNNLFLRKVCGQNQQYLLRILLEVQSMKWNGLFVGRPSRLIIVRSILESLERGETSYLHNIYPSPEYFERQADFALFQSTNPRMMLLIPPSRVYFKTNKVTNALLKPQTDRDEFVLYKILMECLAMIAENIYAETINSCGNKQTYNYLKKCKHLLAPFASLCTCAGKLYLATFYYLVGNYSQALHLCKFMTSPSRVFISPYANTLEFKNYTKTFCGKGYSWYRKCDGYANTMRIRKQFCPDELLLEARSLPGDLAFSIPSLLYALFLKFLCHHHLGDIRRCKETLKYLERKFNESLDSQEMGFSRDDNHKTVITLFWTVHSLLGICYQHIGDYPMAITTFGNSLKEGPAFNPAKERIAMIYLVMCYQHWKKS